AVRVIAAQRILFFERMPRFVVGVALVTGYDHDRARLATHPDRVEHGYRTHDIDRKRLERIGVALADDGLCSQMQHHGRLAPPPRPPPGGSGAEGLARAAAHNS